MTKIVQEIRIVSRLALRRVATTRIYGAYLRRIAVSSLKEESCAFFGRAHRSTADLKEITTIGLLKALSIWMLWFTTRKIS